MNKMIDYSSGKLIVTKKNGSSLFKFDVRDYVHAFSLIAIRDDLEQQARSFDIKRCVTTFIKNHELCLQKSFMERFEPLLALCSFAASQICHMVACPWMG